MEVGEFAFVFLKAAAANDGFPGQDAVFEGVHFGGIPSSRGFGPSGFLGVGAVGRDLLR